VTSVTLSAATGVLRMIADRHYASDVIAGGLLGFGFGFGLPMLLHYQPLFASRTMRVAPQVSTSVVALSWSGVF
jgi:membrane-associated phospholipid phosphatase